MVSNTKMVSKHLRWLFQKKKPTSPFLNGGIFEYSVEQITVSSLTIGRYESTPKYCLHSLDVDAK